MTLVNRLLDGESEIPPSVTDDFCNVVVGLYEGKIRIKFHPRSPEDLLISKDQAVAMAHMLLAKARLMDE